MQIVSLEFWITLQIVDPDHFFGLRKLSFWFVLLLILQIVPPDQFLSITQIVSLDHIIENLIQITCFELCKLSL